MVRTFPIPKAMKEADDRQRHDDAEASSEFTSQRR
jgi:hypothetical protein